MVILSYDRLSPIGVGDSQFTFLANVKYVSTVKITSTNVKTSNVFIYVLFRFQKAQPPDYSYVVLI